MATALEYWIYRDGRERRNGPQVLAELLVLVAAIEGKTGELARRKAVDALIASGELEAALADAGVASAVDVAFVSDELAAAALGHARDSRALCGRLSSVAMPGHVTISVPEGFAYYALHPEAYARAACALRLGAGGALVVGVRSIGTTLSAMACAGLKARGVRATRITVRPDGHPHARRLELGDAQRATVLRARDQGARMLVVDEGPGISGSTFIATAEAVEDAGVSADRITLVFSHEPDLESLTAPNAAARLRRFARMVAPSDVRVPQGDTDLSAGAWRSHVYGPSRRDRDWPASVTHTERRKLLVGGGRLLKFEGLGRTGRAATGRGAFLAGASLSPAAHDDGDGWASYAWHGTPLARRDLDAGVIDHLATYCAKRSALCPCSSPVADLEAMTAKNLAAGLSRVDPPALPIERLFVADGRMAPHEWLRAADGSLTKVDAISHGDDHFFPGPTDVAWDLAGAIVEWELDGAASERLLATYRRASSDDARSRIAAWTLAYASFRLAFTQHGMAASRDAGERGRLAREAARYRAAARAAPRLGRA
jgi:hypothetical protein